MNEHNTNFYSLENIKETLESCKDFLDGEEVYYHIGALRYAYEEIERLRNEIKKISEQHIYTLDKLIETQTRIEKTIEYIKYIKENGYIDLNGYDLLKITGGDE